MSRPGRAIQRHFKKIVGERKNVEERKREVKKKKKKPRTI
jgi:hypothetical protein